MTVWPRLGREGLRNLLKKGQEPSAECLGVHEAMYSVFSWEGADMALGATGKDLSKEGSVQELCDRGQWTFRTEKDF